MIRPVERGSQIRVVIITIGLLLTLNGLATWIWTGEVRAVQSPFPGGTFDIGGVAIAYADVGTIAVCFAAVVVMWAFFQFTKVGLAMRAAAVNPNEARLVGVRVPLMLGLGWGLAAVLGAIAGMLTAPSVFLDPNMMQSVLIYAFAAAVLGGIDSPIGAVVGGLILGVGLNLIGTYIDFIGVRPPPAGGAARDPRRPPRPPGRPLREARGEEGMSRATLRTLIVFVVVSVIVFTLPAFVNDFRAQQFSYVGIYLVALIGLNILTGYTGQISLGHGAFMAIGGYTTAILMTDHGVKDIVTIPIAIVVTGVAGFLFGLPAARLSGLYLALATFAIAVAMPSVIKRFEGFTGGGSGVNLFGTPELTASLTPVRIAGFELNFNNWLYYLAWSIAMIGYVIGWLILRGRTGRAFRAVRDSETAAVSSGVSLARTKALAFGISAAYAGAAGALFAIATTYVNPDTFPVALSIFLLVGVVVAGLGSLQGLIIGAIFIQFMPLWAQNISKSPGAPAVIYGAFLILVVLALPGGAAGLISRLTQLTRRGRDFQKP